MLSLLFLFLLLVLLPFLLFLLLLADLLLSAHLRTGGLRRLDLDGVLLLDVLIPYFEETIQLVLDNIVITLEL